MLNTEMLTKVRLLLDEASADFYLDADIYIALSEAQRELVKVVATSWYENGREQMKPIPTAINTLVATATGTIASGAKLFNLANIIIPLSLQWNPAGAVSAGKQCTFVGSGGSLLKLLENRLLADGYYSYWDGAIVYVNPVSADASAGYSFDYIDNPTNISGAVQPVVHDVANDAVIERAMWILLADRESEQANIHLQLYSTLLQGLMK